MKVALTPAAGDRASELRRRALRRRHRRQPAAAKAGAEALETDFEELRGAGRAGDRHGRRPDPRGHREEPLVPLGDRRPGQDRRGACRRPATSRHSTFANNRLIPNAIEPRACVAVYDAAADEITLNTTSQNPHLERLILTAFVSLAPEHKLRVISPDVGGGFGSKIFVYPEETAVAWAARALNRPVKWTADRSEAFLSDAHGRDHLTTAELGMDADGNVPGPAGEDPGEPGRLSSTFGSAVPTYLYGTLLAGQYKTPAIYVEVDGVYTNTAPVDAYRGAGRPEATYVVERIVETAAREMKHRPGRDPPAQLHPTSSPTRRRSRWSTTSATTSRAWPRRSSSPTCAGFPARRAEAEARGMKRGLGYSCYIEACGLAPSKIAISARRRRRPLRERRGPREPDRLGHRFHRLPQPRPGSRDDLRAGRREQARHSHRSGRGRPWRHRPGGVRPRHLRLALAGGRRLGAGAFGREDHRQGQADRRPHDGDDARRGRLRRGRVYRARYATRR